MDPATQSIIAVIAHPIAGNPSQFAIERALASMELDWRVLSLDVRPEDVPAALKGFDVTGIFGVLIDRSLRDAATEWYREQLDADSGPIDCLYRDDDGKLVGANEQRRWLCDLVAASANDEPTAEGSAADRVWFGGSLPTALIDPDLFPAEPGFLPPDADSLENTKWIALSEGANGPMELEAEDWPENDGSVSVIDLTPGEFSAGHPELWRIKKLGYSTLDLFDRKIAWLHQCLLRWTGKEPAEDVLRDAIEEYLGV